MAAQTGRDNADEDRLWVRDTTADHRWVCDYGADRSPEESAFGGGTHDSVETDGEVGAVGTGLFSVDPGLRRLCAKCAGQLQDGDSIQDDDWGHGDHGVSGNIVLVRIPGAAVWGSVVLRQASVRRRTHSGIDRDAAGVLPGRTVYRAGWDGRFRRTGYTFEMGLSAFAWDAGRCSGRFRRKPGRSVSRGSDSGIGAAHWIDVDRARGHSGGLYRKHDSAEVGACLRFRACGAGARGIWRELA